jgi:hypothetical protein
MGGDTDITADFVIKQSSTYIAPKLDNLFGIFDSFQSLLYTGIDEN